MYLSELLIDVGENPDRPRPGRLWLRNIYHVHQRLSMGFPSERQLAEDPEFLAPFEPGGFEPPRFLFRIEPQNNARVIILVQSQSLPDWTYAFRNASMFLAASPQTREYRPTTMPGQEMRFRIRINLSRKSKWAQDGTDFRKFSQRTDSKGHPKYQSKRIGLTWDNQSGPDRTVREWFAAKGRHHGFTVDSMEVLHLGWVRGAKPKHTVSDSSEDGGRRTISLRSALLEGTLSVTDPAAFNTALRCGVGAAKAFGFGLLSVLPVRR